MKKGIIFDLDETLGYFSQFSIFWYSLTNMLTTIKKQNIINQSLFNKCLDLYPEFLRYKILYVLNYIKEYKIKTNNFLVFIYTNNQGDNQWINYVVNYLQYKINFKLFDRVIKSYKIGDKIVEPKRTSYNKKYIDFINITGMSINAKLIFFDDLYHKDMLNKNLTYVKLYPYQHDLTYNIIISRFINSNIIDFNKLLYNKIQKEEQKQLLDEIIMKNFIRKILTRMMTSYRYKFSYRKINHTKKDIEEFKRIFIHLKNFINPTNTNVPYDTTNTNYPNYTTNTKNTIDVTKTNLKNTTFSKKLEKTNDKLQINSHKKTKKNIADRAYSHRHLTDTIA